MRPFDFRDARVLLTGAGSGIGEHLARQLDDAAGDLVVVDKDKDRLEKVAGDLSRADVRVVDLSRSDELSALCDEVHSAPFDLVINNAGVALGGTFEQVSAEDFDWLMSINFRAPVALIRAALPKMPRGGHIVNVSSLFGLVAPAGQTAYSASKFALRGFSEALRREIGPKGIGVSTVHPGGIKTRIAASARIAVAPSSSQAAANRKAIAKMLTYAPEDAAREILDGVRDRRARILITREAKIVDAAARLMPVDHLENLHAARRFVGRLRFGGKR